MAENKPLRCPRCENNLTRQKTPSGFHYICEKCNGLAVNFPVLQHDRVTDEFIKGLWKATRNEEITRERRCPHCTKLMAEVNAPTPSGEVTLDLCQPCQTIWFDTDELDKLPRKPPPIPEKPLPEEARDAMLATELEAMREKYDSENRRPSSWSKTTGTILDFPAEDNESPVLKPPYITWGLITLVIFIFIISLTEKSDFAFEYGLVPYWGDWNSIWTMKRSYLSLYNIIPLVYTLYFLLIFGDNAESKLGKIKFLLLVLFSHGAGLLTAYLVYPDLNPPIFGCGAIVVGIMATMRCSFRAPRLR